MSLKLYSVSLELRGPGDYRSLHERLRTFGATSVLANQWALRTTHTAVELRNILRDFVADKDRIVVAEIGAEYASRRALTDLGKL